MVLSGSKLLCVFSEDSAFTGKEVVGVGSVGLDGFSLACSLSVRTMGEDGESGCQLTSRELIEGRETVRHVGGTLRLSEY